MFSLWPHDGSALDYNYDMRGVETWQVLAGLYSLSFWVPVAPGNHTGLLFLLCFVSHVNTRWDVIHIPADVFEENQRNAKKKNIS